MKRLPLTLLLLLFLTGCQLAPPAADIVLPPLFSDHMVLQRDANINVWGKATPNSKVTVRFNNQKSEITSSADSSWRVVLAPEEAGGPFALTIEGETTLTINDVLVGEVWLASGQSNMEWPLSATNDAEEAIAAAQDDQIRLFTVRKTVSDTPEYTIPADGWRITNPETIGSFSAVAYYFAQTLRDSLNVPVGLINSSWGGTRAEAWTSSETLLEHPDYAATVREMLDNSNGSNPIASEADWRKALHDNDAGYSGTTAAWAAADLDASAWPVMALPQLWESELAGLDGIVWFRKTITLPATWDGKEATISVGRIDDEDQTWVNGTLVGETVSYNALRSYTVPAGVLKAGDNVIVIRALDTGGGGGVWGEPEEMSISLGNARTTQSLTGNWQYKVGLDVADAVLPKRPSGVQHTPTVLYNAMINPLVPYALKGVIWYQGESNAGRAHQYQTLFPAMIQDWRTKWNSPFGFHFVQLANFMKQQVNPVEEETWPELREAQTMALDLPNTGMAVTIDIGEADDIHPRNKKDVGFRLALAALDATYGHNNTPAGPLYKSHTVSGDSVRVTFSYATDGLMSSMDELRGFAIAGEDQQWHHANAAIDGSQVVLHSDRVSNPVAVRYGWANNPVVSLYNTEGLPASPFRTDDWPGITVGKK